MKPKKQLFAAIIVGGSLGLAANSVGAQDGIYNRQEMAPERHQTTSGDDQSLAPGVPGVTEDNTSDMTKDEVSRVQQALVGEGYDPGRSDGAMDENTRAAIRDFQKDHDIVVTGSLDSKTAEVLGIEFSRSSG